MKNLGCKGFILSTDERHIASSLPRTTGNYTVVQHHIVLTAGSYTVVQTCGQISKWVANLFLMELPAG